jgi:hypothetical protein
LTLRALSGRRDPRASRRVADYFISKGITPELRFDQITGVRLGLVRADLGYDQPVIYGLDRGHRFWMG